jgi:UDP:flavonoid glycosyltransferase YjiC (YdhE family)
MGITQKALSFGVPVCVIPFGRDQHEVARHVAVAEACVTLSRRRLTPASVRDAVRRTRACTDGARRVADGFRSAGGALRAATAVESLLTSRSITEGPHEPAPSGPGDIQ